MSEHRQMILGVDFDDTLFLNSFPDNFTEPNWPVIDYVRQRQSEGWYLILVTCRTSADHVRSALGAAESVGIYFDDVNANHPDIIERFGDCRKIYCDEYIDDKNISIKDLEPKTTSNAIAEKQQPVVYIAGKMRGLEDLGRTHFNLAEMYMREKGFVVLNPSRLPDGMSDEQYMPICLSMLEAAATVLIHEGSGAIEGDAVKVIDQAESYKAMVKKMHNYILSHSRIPASTLTRKKNNDWELSAADCLKYGVCDVIVENLNEIL